MSSSQDIKLSLFHHRWVSQLVELMQFLWGEDEQANRSYFKWKYEDNPYTEIPLGVVALSNEQVVGFRGYFAMQYQITGLNQKLTILNPGDTVVHPDYRRMGLSVRMGELAARELSAQYRIMLNTTSTSVSLPGYLRMGFQPVTPKTYHSRYRVTGLLSYILKYRDPSPPRRDWTSPAMVGEIMVADEPRPDEMASVIEMQRHDQKKLEVYQDQAFFQWRYQNNKNHYRFYYDLQGGSTKGYVVIRLSPNHRRGYIVDSGAIEPASIERILQVIIDQRHLDIISIYRHCIDPSLSSLLDKLGFKTNSLVRKIENKMNGELPLLVKPVRKDATESDFIIQDLDVRKFESWSLKGICSDDM